MELSRNYQMVNKSTAGEIVIADLGRKGNITVFVLTAENQTKNAATLRKFETIEELLTSFSFETEWFKNSELIDGYEFINTCYYSEKSRYGVGSENRKKSN